MPVPVPAAPALAPAVEGNHGLGIFSMNPVTSWFSTSAKTIRQVFSGNGKLPHPGLYHHRIDLDGGYARVHLRVNPDFSGCLVIDAAQMIHLNPTATIITHYYLDGLNKAEIIHKVATTFNADRVEIEQDVIDTTYRLDELLHPDGACPIHELELDTTMPFSAELTAPYRMDLALTYRCNNDCHHCYNARPRTFTEMDTAHWKQVIDRVWDLTIPHVVFTGGEPTLREDLPELIAYAEKKGLITGLNTNGRRLGAADYVAKLVKAGLDHVQITLESHLPDIHDQMVNCRGAWHQTVDGVRNALDSHLYVMTNTTMLQPNTPHLDGTLQFLSELGVPTIGLNSLIYSGRGTNVNNGLQEDQLEQHLAHAKDHVQRTGQKLIWYTPTQYCNFDPVTMELGIKGCSAARYNMCIEPDGSVLPCQSYYHSLGNILSNKWTDIWLHPISTSIRNRTNVPAKCNGCSLLVECGGGCPLLYDKPIAETVGMSNQ